MAKDILIQGCPNYSEAPATEQGSNEIDDPHREGVAGEDHLFYVERVPH